MYTPNKPQFVVSHDSEPLPFYKIGGENDGIPDGAIVTVEAALEDRDEKNRLLGRRATYTLKLIAKNNEAITAASRYPRPTLTELVFLSSEPPFDPEFFAIPEDTEQTNVVGDVLTLGQEFNLIAWSTASADVHAISSSELRTLSIFANVKDVNKATAPNTFNINVSDEEF
jgi:hypothetical protein